MSPQDEAGSSAAAAVPYSDVSHTLAADTSGEDGAAARGPFDAGGEGAMTPRFCETRPGLPSEEEVPGPRCP